MLCCKRIVHFRIITMDGIAITLLLAVFSSRLSFWSWIVHLFLLLSISLSLFLIFSIQKYVLIIFTLNVKLGANRSCVFIQVQKVSSFLLVSLPSTLAHRIFTHSNVPKRGFY